MARKPRDPRKSHMDGRSGVQSLGVVAGYGTRGEREGSRSDDAEERDETPEQEAAEQRETRLALMRTQYQEFLAGWAEARAQAEDDDKFLLGLNQWDPDEVMTKRKGRSSLTYNMLPDPFHQIVNDIRANAPAVIIEPDDDSADEDVANVLMGKLRHVNGAGNAFEYKMDATAQSVSGGWGYWRLKTEYSDPNTFDLDVVAEGIRNRFAVVDDPAAQEPDMRDRRALFYLGRPLSKAEWEERYENEPVLNKGLLAGTGLELLWGKDSIPEIEYWFREIVDWRTVATTEEDAEGKPLRTRRVPVWGVKMWKTNGQEVLIERAQGGEPARECTYTWDGQWIPFVTVFGWRMDLNGALHVEGMVRQARDTQRTKNYVESELVDAVGEDTKSQWLAPVKSVAEFKKFWDSRNTTHWPYLPYEPVITPGGILLPTKVQGSTAPQGVLAAKESADQNLMRQLGAGTSSQGEADNDPSGYARQQRRAEHDMGRQHYLNGLAIAERFEADLILDLAPVIWGNARQMHTLSDDGTLGKVSVNKPQPDPTDPMQDLPPGDERRAAVWTTNELAPGNPRGKVTKHYDLTVGRYRVRKTMGPNFATEREEQMQWLDAAAQRATDPRERLVVMYFWAKASRVRDHEKLAQTILAMLPPEIQQAMADQGDTTDKQQLQQLRAQVAQLVPMVQQAGQMLQMLKQKVDDKQAKLMLDAAIAADHVAIEKLKVLGHATVGQMQSETTLIKEGMRGHHERMSIAAAGHIDQLGAQAAAERDQERSQAGAVAEGAAAAGGGAAPGGQPAGG